MKQDKNFLKTRNIVFIIMIVALLFAAFFYKSPASFFARNMVFRISAPIMEKFSGVARFFGNGMFLSKKSLIGENQKLKEDNQNLVLRLSSLTPLELENKELKSLLNMKEVKPGFEFISARPVGFIRDGQDEYIFISRGLKDGVHSDLWVLDSQNVFVGLVVEAYQTSSKVKLVTSASETINGFLPSSGIRVLVKGNGSREFIVDLVPENIEVKEGDEVWAAENWEYSGLIPLLGKIVEVGPSGSQVFKRVRASHYFDPKALEPVFVVKKP